MKNKNLFVLTLIILVFIEIISFNGFLVPVINYIGFFIIFLTTVVLSWRKIEFGLLIALVELIISSKGYLFYFNYNEHLISIRIAIWFAVMFVWSIKLFIKFSKNLKILDQSYDLGYAKFGVWQQYLYKKNVLQNLFYTLLVFIIFGIINGFLNHNQLKNIFFDFNGWLYFLYIFPVLDIIKIKNLKNFYIIFFSVITWLCLKTFLFLYIFSHSFLINGQIYKWIRTSGVGEITQMSNGFSRVFLQSHIFVVVAFFIISFLSINFFKQKQKKEFLLSILFLSILIAVNLISFSRSNWAGIIVGIFIFFILSIFIHGWKKIWIPILTQLVSVILGLLIITIIVKFPFPQAGTEFNASKMIKNRASEITTEAGVSSRWNLLSPLFGEIKQYSIFGKGFGSTITYISNDPRIREKNSDGIYTTYAFEWGLLDIWLKIGLFGLLIYIAIIFNIIYNLLKQSLKDKKNISKNNLINLGIAVSLIVLFVINIFSPYLNHPLGIGIILLSWVCREIPD